MKKKLLSIALCAAGAVHAQFFHLTIDLSNPSTAVFTATTRKSDSDSQTTQLFDGITLYDFFYPAFADPVSGSVTGSLQPSTSDPGLSYDRWTSDQIVPTVYSDLNLYRSSGTLPQTFSKDSQALTGSAVIDLSSQIGNLPVFGTTGWIMGGYSGNLDYAIGLWEVIGAPPVPELPVGAHLAVYGLGFAGVWAYRRSRKA